MSRLRVHDTSQTSIPSSSFTTVRSAGLQLDVVNSSQLIQPIYNSPSTHQTFSLFPKLPQEIQDTVWVYARYTVTPPRVIKPLRSKNGTSVIYTSAPIPALLHVSSGSRLAAKKYYNLTFSGNGRQEACIYFDFQRDFLYQCAILEPCLCYTPIEFGIQTSCGRSSICVDDRNKIERLVVEWCDSDRTSEWFDVERRYKSLKDVIVLSTKPGERMSGDWAWERDFETVVDHDEELTMMKSREKWKGLSWMFTPNIVAGIEWTIEEARRAKLVVDLIEDEE